MSRISARSFREEVKTLVKEAHPMTRDGKVVVKMPDGTLYEVDGVSIDQFIAGQVPLLTLTVGEQHVP